MLVLQNEANFLKGYQRTSQSKVSPAVRQLAGEGEGVASERGASSFVVGCAVGKRPG